MGILNAGKHPLGSVIDLTLIADHKGQKDELFDVLAFCQLDGFGGRCFGAAMAIRDVLFHGKGVVAIALNDALGDTGLFSGHAAVLYLDRYWDSEGDHDLDHIKDYARFEVDDADYAARYTEFTGKAWDAKAATTVSVHHYPDGIAMWPDRETDYEEFADKLFAALKLKTESPAGAESGNEAPK
jgi:hypothetical protein